jgi:two-component system CitB family response regulator
MKMNFAKGSNKFIYKIIWDTIEISKYEDFTAEEIAEKSVIARVTIRRYVEYMEKEIR